MLVTESKLRQIVKEEYAALQREAGQGLRFSSGEKDDEGRSKRGRHAPLPELTKQDGVEASRIANEFKKILKTDKDEHKAASYLEGVKNDLRQKISDERYLFEMFSAIKLFVRSKEAYPGSRQIEDKLLEIFNK